MIDYRCNCGQEYQLKDQLAGRSVQCHKCGAVGTVPALKAPRTAAVPPVTEISGVGEIMAKTWQAYKSRVWPLLGLLLLAAGLTLSILAVLLGTGYAIAKLIPGHKNAVMLCAGFLAMFGAFYAVCRSQMAFILAVMDQSLTIQGAFARARGGILAYFWLSVLMGFLIGGGQLLLVAPGILFLVWFFFAPFVFIEEDLRGMDALMRSRELVRGRWLPVAVRLFLAWAGSALLALIPVVGQILAVFIIPFLFIHAFLLYRELKAVKGPAPFVPKTPAKLAVMGVGLAGFLFIPLLFITLFGAMMTGVYLKIRGLMQNPLQAPQSITTVAADETAPLEQGEVYRGAAMLDVTCYGYEVNVEINGERVYSDRDRSFSGVVKALTGRNSLRVSYQPAENPHLKMLKVGVRLLENGEERKLIDWKASASSGEENLTFQILGQPAGSVPPDLTVTDQTSNGAGSEAELVEKYKRAHAAKDAEAYADLLCMKGVTEDTLGKTKSLVKDMIFQIDYEDVTIGPKREGQGASYTLQGITYGPNLEITGSIVIKFKDGASYLPIGMEDGRYYIVSAVPASKQ